MPVEIVDKLKLKPGVQAVASVTSTNVIIHTRPTIAQEPDVI
jgi:molybdopterin-binding protein